MNDDLIEDFKYFIKTFDKISKDSEDDKAYGAILGAFIGDSCGSYHEFSKRQLNDNEMNECMMMPGGGPHKVAPGQVTNDSELALCLMNSIIESN